MAKKIIVIDDSQTVRQQVSMVLKGAGYEVIEAEDGIEGASAIKANAGASLAICDVNMPRQGGLEMLESLRADNAALKFPVIMLTTEGRPDLIERARTSSRSSRPCCSPRSGRSLGTPRKREACPQKLPL